MSNYVVALLPGGVWRARCTCHGLEGRGHNVPTAVAVTRSLHR